MTKCLNDTLSFDEALTQYLKDHLSININTFNDYYDSGIEVELTLGDEVISSSRASINTKCNCSDSSY